MKTIFIFRLTAIILCFLAGPTMPVSVHAEAGKQAPKEFSIGIHDEAKLVPAKVIESPAPQIPAHKQEESFKTSCEARFLIDATGKATVTLVTSSGSEEIDELALKTLRTWKFKPATLEDKPVPSSRRIKIEFEIE